MLRKSFTKTITLGLLLIGAAYQGANAQTPDPQDTIIYLGFFNSVPNNFDYPMLGLANVANENYSRFQIGLLNITKGNLNGAQVGISNLASGNINGAQIGTLNFAEKSVDGVQIGAYNLISGKLDGATFGAFNVSNDSIGGAQFGSVNISLSSVDGAQLGAVNISAGEVDGGQFGALNIAGNKVDGAQIGTVNFSRKLDGFQLGVFNYVDSLESGVPLGLVSIVRKGGYFAIDLVEVYTARDFPAGISVRLGAKSLYTKYVVSIVEKDNASFGLGLGSLIPINKRLFINPEMVYHQNFTNDDSFWKNSSHTSLSASFGVNLNRWFQVSAGPVVSLSYKGTESDFLLSDLYTHKLNDNSNLNVGFKASLTLVLSK